MPDPWLIAVMGPTGSGKSELAEALADRLDAQLINADAFQVYRGLDIGTNKPAARERYALLDILDPTENFGVGEWVRLALPILERCFAEGRSVVAVGGTGLYIRALFEEYADMMGAPDPEVRRQVAAWREEEGLEGLLRRLEPHGISEGLDPLNPVRVGRALERALAKSPGESFSLPPFIKKKFGIQVPVETLAKTIVARTGNFVQNGWVAEVGSLRRQGIGEDAPAMRAIGYRSLLQYLDGNVESEEVVAQIVRDTMQYAKRQRTWLRSEPDLIWLEAGIQESLLEQAMNCLVSD